MACERFVGLGTDEPANSSANTAQRRVSTRQRGGVGLDVGEMCSMRSGVRRSLDSQSDTLADGRVVKVLNVIDAFSRERLASEVDRSLDACVESASPRLVIPGCDYFAIGVQHSLFGESPSLG